MHSMRKNDGASVRETPMSKIDGGSIPESMIREEHEEHASITKEIHELRNDISNLKIMMENTIISISDLSHHVKEKLTLLQDAMVNNNNANVGAGGNNLVKKFALDHTNSQTRGLGTAGRAPVQSSLLVHHQQQPQQRLEHSETLADHPKSPRPIHSTTPRGDQVVPILAKEPPTPSLFQPVASKKSMDKDPDDNGVMMSDVSSNESASVRKPDVIPELPRYDIRDAVPQSIPVKAMVQDDSDSDASSTSNFANRVHKFASQSKYMAGTTETSKSAKSAKSTKSESHHSTLEQVSRTVMTMHKSVNTLKRSTGRTDWNNMDDGGDFFIRQMSVRKLITDKSILNRAPSFDDHPVLKRIVSVPVIKKVLAGAYAATTSPIKSSKLKRQRSSMVTQEDIAEAVLLRDQHYHAYTFRHDTIERLRWDAFVLMIVAIDAVLTPLQLSFEFTSIISPFVDVFSNIVYITDFVVNILTSYSSTRGQIQSDAALTARHYLLGPWALFDLLSCFPFEKIIAKQHYLGRGLGMAKAVRLVTVNSVTRRLYNTTRSSGLRAMRLVATVFIVSHWLVCFWNLSANLWREAIPDWNSYSLKNQYLHCWTVVINALNASPPVTYTVSEEVTIAVYMLIGNVMQASVFGAVASFIASIDEDEVAFSKKLISTFERCKFLDIPEKLTHRIHDYYTSLYRETKSVNSDADSFIDELSPALKCEVKYQLYRDMLKQIPFLSSRRIDSSLVELLVLQLRGSIYMQDDVVTRKGEYGDWMGFIGAKGSVAVLDPDSYNRSVKRILRKGDYFGEMALLQATKRTTTIIALSWVQVHVLTRENLEHVKANSPDQAQVLEEEMNKYFHSKLAYRF